MNIRGAVNMLEKGDRVLINYKSSRLHNKPCIVISRQCNRVGAITYTVAPMNPKLNPKECTFLAEYVIFTNPFALVDLLGKLKGAANSDWRNEVVQKFNLKLGETHEN